jgi:hypothetical protein
MESIYTPEEKHVGLRKDLEARDMKMFKFSTCRRVSKHIFVRSKEEEEKG